jgi:hypothetical protein
VTETWDTYLEILGPELAAAAIAAGATAPPPPPEVGELLRQVFTAEAVPADDTSATAA